MPISKDTESFYSESAEDIRRRVNQDLSGLQRRPRPLLTRMAQACRILERRGHARTLAGQITLRAPDGETFWTTRMDGGFADAMPSDMVRINPDMEVLEGSGIPNPAVRFHLWIYRERPELNCIVHTHPPYCAALSMTGQPLTVAHMDAMMFYEDCAFLPEWPGVPLANEEGELISRALGRRRSILLAHHGLLTTGRSLEEAIYLAVSLEYAAQMQLLAHSAGGVVPVRADRARAAHEFMTGEALVALTFDYWARQL